MLFPCGYGVIGACIEREGFVEIAPAHQLSRSNGTRKAISGGDIAIGAGRHGGHGPLIISPARHGAIARQSASMRIAGRDFGEGSAGGQGPTIAVAAPTNGSSTYFAGASEGIACGDMIQGAGIDRGPAGQVRSPTHHFLAGAHATGEAVGRIDATESISGGHVFSVRGNRRGMGPAGGDAGVVEAASHGSGSGDIGKGSRGLRLQGKMRPACGRSTGFQGAESGGARGHFGVRACRGGASVFAGKRNAFDSSVCLDSAEGILSSSDMGESSGRMIQVPGRFAEAGNRAVAGTNATESTSRGDLDEAGQRSVGEDRRFAPASQ